MSQSRKVSVPCQAALDELARTSANVKRFWNLIYAVGAVTAAVLIYAVVLVALGQALPAAFSGIASILGGSGTAFLSKRKNEAVAELQEAKESVSSDCAPGTGGRGSGEEEFSVREWMEGLLAAI